MGPNATSSPDGYMVQKSTNSGSTWSSSIRGTGPTSGFDKEMIAVDNLANSPYANYFYCGWTEFIGGNGSLQNAAVKLNRSTDGGQTFSSPTTLRQSGNSTGGGQGACLATGPQGEVYVCWADYSTGSVPANGIGFAKSTNGGTSFTSGVAFAYQGIRQSGADPRFNNTRVNDFPSIAVDKSYGAYRGRIYIVYPNGGNGSNNQSVIQLRYSSDGGGTWSGAQTISISNGGQNWFPWIAVDDSTGDVSVIYYSLDGASGFSTNTYVAHSSSGGANWETIKVSDVAHTTAPIPGFLGGYAGDYIGICAFAGKAYPAWMDDRNGTWRIYTSPLSYMLVVSISGPGSLQLNTWGSYSATASNGSGNYSYAWYKNRTYAGSQNPIRLYADTWPIMSISVTATDNSSGKTATDNFDVNVWCTNCPQIVTGDSVQIDPASSQPPDQIMVGQNFPNPFNPTTNISFGLPHETYIRLVVYDMLGREVARLVDGMTSAGYHTVTWDASRLASGIYIYKLTAGNFVQMKRMILMK